MTGYRPNSEKREDDKDLNLIARLHSAARFYLIERSKFWREKYAEVQRAGRALIGENYSYEAQNIFPRYIVLDAILHSVERFTPEDYDSLSEERDLLVAAAGPAVFQNFINPDPVQEKAVREEECKFIEYVKGLSASDLQSTECIPYRRVLSPDEASKKKSLLKSKWEIWLWSSDTNENLVGFSQNSFNNEVDSHKIQNLLKKHKVERVLEFPEYGANYEIDVSFFKPFYKKIDTYYSSMQMDWIVFASHEDLVLIGGWLLGEIKNIWPKWNSNLWGSTNNG